MSARHSPATLSTSWAKRCRVQRMACVSSSCRRPLPLLRGGVLAAAEASIVALRQLRLQRQCGRMWQQSTAAAAAWLCQQQQQQLEGRVTCVRRPSLLIQYEHLNPSRTEL
jgi:hypothetical protein